MSKERVILTNPDEPRAGDYAYQFYDNTHPLNGRPAVIEDMRRQLRGLRGETVIMQVKGARIDDDGVTRRFTARREFKLERYGDVFGPGSAFGSVIHAVRERHSDETLIVFTLTIETIS